MSPRFAEYATSGNLVGCKLHWHYMALLHHSRIALYNGSLGVGATIKGLLLSRNRAADARKGGNANCQPDQAGLTLCHAMCTCAELTHAQRPDLTWDPYIYIILYHLMLR